MHGHDCTHTHTLTHTHTHTHTHVDGGSAGSDGSAEDEVPLSAAAQKLNLMLERLERIPLEMRLLQVG